MKYMQALEQAKQIKIIKNDQMSRHQFTREKASRVLSAWDEKSRILTALPLKVDMRLESDEEFTKTTNSMPTENKPITAFFRSPNISFFIMQSSWLVWIFGQPVNVLWKKALLYCGVSKHMKYFLVKQFWNSMSSLFLV